MATSACEPLSASSATAAANCRPRPCTRPRRDPVNAVPGAGHRDRRTRRRQITRARGRTGARTFPNDQRVGVRGSLSMTSSRRRHRTRRSAGARRAARGRAPRAPPPARAASPPSPITSARRISHCRRRATKAFKDSNARPPRHEQHMSAAAAQPDARRTAGVNANAVLAIVAVAQFMVILDASIVNVALPTIKRDVGFSEQSLSVDPERVHADIRGLPAARRPGCRPARAAAAVHGRHRAVRCAHRSSVASRSPRASCSSPAASRGWAGRWCRRRRSRSS